MTIVPLTLRQANALVAALHRHHKPARDCRFCLGVEASGRLVGAAIAGRPQARLVEQYRELSVTRLVTDGTPNACSMLYGAVARTAKAMGYVRVRTEILAEEPGTSLRAAGYRFSHMTKGGDWNRPSRGGRRRDQPEGPKQVWVRELHPAG